MAWEIIVDFFPRGTEKENKFVEHVTLPWPHIPRNIYYFLKYCDTIVVDYIFLITSFTEIFHSNLFPHSNISSGYLLSVYGVYAINHIMLTLTVIPNQQTIELNAYAHYLTVINIIIVTMLIYKGE